MIDLHPELAMPLETRFVLESWPLRAAFGDLRHEANRRRLASWIFMRRESAAHRLGLERSAAIERLSDAAPTFGSVLGLPFVLHAEAQRKPRWGDKRPSYAQRMDVVWSLFPNAQFVNLVRDPRGCVASMRKLGWWRGKVAPAIALWERSVGTVDEWRPRLAEDQLLDVRYEDLIGDPEGTLARIVRFARLSADEAAIAGMLRYHERGERLSRRYHAHLSQPLDPARLTGWREELRPGQVTLVEEATRASMARLGYEPVMAGRRPRRKAQKSVERHRSRQAARRRRRRWEDRLRRYVTYRRPVAADLPPPQVSGTESRTPAGARATHGS